MKYLTPKSIFTAAIALWLLGPISAIAETIDYDFNFSGGTGSFVYDDVVLDMDPIMMDFELLGSIETDFGAGLTDSVFGNPPGPWTINDNVFFGLKINGVLESRLRLWSDGRYCIRYDGSGCLWDGSDAATGTYNIAPASDAQVLSCSGFDSPLDDGAVKVKKNRALPFKARLQDESLQYVDDSWLTAPPVIQVIFDDGSGGGDDVSNEALYAGAGTEGNQFEFINDQWQFNLKIKNYSASGTYDVQMVSGDESEYVIDPTCDAQFAVISK